MQCNRHYCAVSQVCNRAGGEIETSSCPTPLHDTMIFSKQDVRMHFQKRWSAKDLAPQSGRCSVHRTLLLQDADPRLRQMLTFNANAGHPGSTGRLQTGKSAKRRRDVLHEHHHLHLRHHRIAHRPELVHHESHRKQKQHDQPRADFCAIAQENA
jgi:hypothetical protein